MRRVIVIAKKVNVYRSIVVVTLLGLDAMIVAIVEIARMLKTNYSFIILLNY